MPKLRKTPNPEIPQNPKTANFQAMTREVISQLSESWRMPRAKSKPCGWSGEGVRPEKRLHDVHPIFRDGPLRPAKSTPAARASARRLRTLSRVQRTNIL